MTVGKIEEYRKIQEKRAYIMNTLNPGGVNADTVAEVLETIFPNDEERVIKENVELLFSYIDKGKKNYWACKGLSKEEVMKKLLVDELKDKDDVQKKGYLMRFIRNFYEDATDNEIEGKVLKQLATGDYEKLYEFLVRMANDNADIFINEIQENLTAVKANLDTGAPEFDHTKEWTLDERGKIEAAASLAVALEGGGYWEDSELKKCIGLVIGSQIAGGEDISSFMPKENEGVTVSDDFDEYSYVDYDEDEEEAFLLLGELIFSVLFLYDISRGTEESVFIGLMTGIEKAFESFVLPTWWPWALAGAAVAIGAIVIANKVIKDKEAARNSLRETCTEIEEYNIEEETDDPDYEQTSIAGMESEDEDEAEIGLSEE